MRPSGAWSLLAALLVCACADGPAPDVERAPVDEAVRESALRAARAWHAIDTAALDLRAGPPGSLRPGALIDCSFVVPQTPPGGQTPKFLCRDENGQLFKVKYGSGNMEVYGETFGARLLWALGFFSDRIDPVRVRCRGCPEDPWGFLRSLEPSDPRPAPRTDVVREFGPAIVETYYGRRIQAHGGQGLPWPALLEVRSRDPETAGEQAVHREALTLLAAFLAHGDSKAQNQTLACEPGGGPAHACRRPVVYIGDLGAILGRGFFVITSKVDIEDWASHGVWRDPEACVARFDTHPLGTLRDTRIAEPARAFLAGRLAALSRSQIRTLFDVAGLDGVGGEVEEDDGDAHPPSLDDWVAAFEDRRRQITDHRCP